MRITIFASVAPKRASNLQALAPEIYFNKIARCNLIIVNFILLKRKILFTISSFTGTEIVNLNS